MVWTVIGVTAVLYVGLVLLLYLLQARLVYFPTRNISATPATIGLKFETVQFETEDGVTLSGWFIPAEDAADVVLFFHGNAGNISHRLQSIELFQRLGVNVLIIDYRGYGRSEGRPSEEGTYLDAEAAWRYLVEQRQIAPGNIIFFGRSLGGAVATWLAGKYAPKSLILESTFTSVPDIGAKQFPFLPVRTLARFRYNSLERLPQIKVPVLIIHSPQDEVIPYAHGQQLFQVANEPKTFIQLSGGHNEGFVITGQPYEAGLKDFIYNAGSIN
jgi:fermentation-respiration switch protein FrsA (DUF1100 family)